MGGGARAPEHPPWIRHCTARIQKLRFGILLSSNISSFFSRPSASVVARLHINPLYFLARMAVCPQISCTSCLSNEDIQTPVQVSVPCILRHNYFHKDTLTPPSSSRSPPLAGGGPSTYAARDASVYNARPLLRDLHHAL